MRGAFSEDVNQQINVIVANGSLAGFCLVDEHVQVVTFVLARVARPHLKLLPSQFVLNDASGACKTIVQRAKLFILVSPVGEALAF